MCNSAGIRVRMITGDNLTTAIAIAKESGILVEGEELDKYKAMEGPEFAKFVGGLVDKKTKEPIEVMGKKSEAE
jgi:magnesium-transporting ATPase (P-type)